MIRRRKLIRRRPLLESRGNRKLIRRRRPLFESRSSDELESLARAISRDFHSDVNEVMKVLKEAERYVPEFIDEIFDDIDYWHDGNVNEWAEMNAYDVFYYIEEQIASAMCNDELSVMSIPSHLLPYLINGDADDLSDEELEEAQEIDRLYDVESPVHLYDEGSFDGYSNSQDYFVRRKNRRR